MSALTRVALLITCGVGLLACKEINPAYCGAHPGDPICPGADGPSVDAAPTEGFCEDNSSCKQAPFLVCELAAHECVQCVALSQTAACQGTTPVCNANFTCEACRVSADCPLSGVCLASGACVAETDVAYVDGDGAPNTACAKATPCTKIQDGLAAVTAGGPRPYVKLKGAYDEAVVITRNVTILAEPGAQLTRSTDGPIVSVTGASVVEINDLLITDSNEPGVITSGTSELTLKRVTVSKNKGNGISCAGKSLVISDSTIAENDLLGISCAAGKVTVSSSTITKNRAGGISAAGGSFDIINNFIYDNGDKSTANVGGVSLDPMPGTANRFEFNTVVDNHIRDSIAAPAGGVVCDVTGFNAPNNIIARNDVNENTLAPNANIDPASRCSYPSSTVTGIALEITELKFVAPNIDPLNYHLQSDSTAIGKATTASTVTVDFDGDARPQGAGKDQGADELSAAQ